MTAFWNSFLIASGTVILSLILGLPLAILLAKTDIPFKKYLKYLYLIPIFIPPSIMVLIWMSFCPAAKWLYSLGGAIVLLALCYFPFVTLLSFGGLSAVGRNIEEAARIDYGELGVLRHVTIPYAANYILAGALFVFVFAISNYEVPALLGVNSFPGEIFAQFSGYYNHKKAFLLALPLISLTSLMIVVVARLMQGKDFMAVNQEWTRPRIIALNRKQKKGAMAFISVLFGISVIGPFSGLASRAGAFAVYVKAFRLSWRELNFSIFWALVGTILIVVLSFSIAYIMERSKTRWRLVLYYASILPFALPATVVGIILIKLFNRPGLNFIYSTPLILLSGYFIRFSPFAIRILSGSISHIDKDIENAAELCGAGFWRKIFVIITPLCRPGLVISLAVVFALIMGELGMTILVVPAGASTLILKIYNLMHYGAGKLVAALALILALLVLVLMGILLLINKRVKRIFLSCIVFLFFMQAASGVCFAGEEKGHLYSTWDVIELDTCASAWLIKRFIDPDAEFKFYAKGELIGRGIAFDTPDAEFRRKQNMSTFESLLEGYKVEDPVLAKLGEMIHEIEVNYWQQAKGRETEEFNQAILEIIDSSEGSLECFKRVFIFLDEIYREIR